MPPRQSGREHGGEPAAAVIERDLPSIDEEPDPIDADTVFAELAAKRQEWADDLQSHDDFQVRVRGNASSMKRLGSAVDAFQGTAVSEEAEHFCMKYGLAKTSQFSIRLCSDDACTLATEWCSRMKRFYSLQAISSDDGHYRFGANCTDDYCSSESFTQLSTRAAGHLLSRVKQVRALMPR